MSGGDVQRPPPIDEALLQQFKQSVKERYGRVRGHYSSELETALEEYLNASEGGDTHDRLTQIERDLEEIKTHLCENEPKKQKAKSGGSRIDKRLQQIVETIRNESDGAPKVHESVVEMAIREHAGVSKPTLKQYKELLQEDKEMFPDLRESKSHWFLDAPTFCTAMNDAVQNRELKADVYEDAVDGQFGREWWGEQVQRFEQEHNERGIQ